MQAQRSLVNWWQMPHSGLNGWRDLHPSLVLDQYYCLQGASATNDIATPHYKSNSSGTADER
jgi:hypothetical protein